MKLSESRPCACCGGPLLGKNIGNWYVLRQTIAIIKPSTARSVVGLAMQFGNPDSIGALRLAESFAPDAEAIAILADQPDAPPATEIHLCFTCYTEKFTELVGLFETAARKKSESQEKGVHENA